MKSSTLFAIVCVIFMGYLMGCGEKGAERSLQVGETAVITPVDNAQLNDSNDSYARKHKNTLIVFKGSTKKIAFEDFSEVQILKNYEAKEPFYVFTNEDLKNMPSTTGCSSDFKKYIEDEKDAATIFCNQEYKYSKTNIYVIKMIDGTDQKANYIQDISDDKGEDLLKLFIEFN